jgi:hypothetical protein
VQVNPKPISSVSFATNFAINWYEYVWVLYALTYRLSPWQHVVQSVAALLVQEQRVVDDSVLNIHTIQGRSKVQRKAPR